MPPGRAAISAPFLIIAREDGITIRGCEFAGDGWSSAHFTRWRQLDCSKTGNQTKRAPYSETFSALRARSSFAGFHPAPGRTLQPRTRTHSYPSPNRPG